MNDLHKIRIDWPNDDRTDASLDLQNVDSGQMFLIAHRLIHSPTEFFSDSVGKDSYLEIIFDGDHLVKYRIHSSNVTVPQLIATGYFLNMQAELAAAEALMRAQQERQLNQIIAAKAIPGVQS